MENLANSDGKVYTCQCIYLHNFYYTIMVDMGLEAEQEIVEPVDGVIDIILLIVIPLVGMGVIFPFLMVYFDAKDYKKIEDNFYGVDDLTCAKLERAMDYLCLQQVYYNEIEIQKYYELEKGVFRAGSWTSFKIYNRRLNPYFNIF